MEPIKETGLGLFLKKEREKKGLSIDHLAKITMLRRHYIEALENEAWDRLPSQVFIKGFLRNYSKALGLDYEEVLRQFESSVPVHDGLPKPLMPPGKTKKAHVFLFLIPIVLAALIVLFFMREPSPPDKKAESAPAKVSETKAAPIADQDKNVKQAQPLNQDVPLNANRPSGNNAVAVIVAEPSSVKENVPSSKLSTAPQDVATERQVQPPMEETPVTTTQTPIQESAAKPADETATDVNEPYKLSGLVTSTTYIKIFIDNNPPRQYIFPRGSRPRWTAKAGFYVLVGNAGGIEFEFNGKKIKDLGGQGVVVRLRLPENFNLNIGEN
jgi:cytoskeletal protein RodZ